MSPFVSNEGSKVLSLYLSTAKSSSRPNLEKAVSSCFLDIITFRMNTLSTFLVHTTDDQKQPHEGPARKL